MTDAILAEGLVKRYKEVTALDGIDLRVPEGSVLALLGPNGAGKTTAVKILTTLITADEGRAEVAGFDVASKPRDVRRSLGVSGQYAAVDEYLTGFENLEMIGRLYHLGRRESADRARELLSEFRLEDAADRPSKTYSGGMQRRLDLAGALVARPAGAVPRRADHRPRPAQPHRDVEPAPGAGLRRHHPAAHHAVPRGGRPARRQHRGDRPRPGDRRGHRRRRSSRRSAASGSRSPCPTPPTCRPRWRRSRRWRPARRRPTTERRTVIVPVSGGAAVLADALRRLDAEGVALDDVGLRRPTLDDVFLSLTGHAAEAEPEAQEAAHR